MTEQEKQRGIGQEILVVRMLQEEKAKIERRGGFPILSIEKIVLWTGWSSEDVTRLKNMTGMLDPFEMSVRAARNYTKNMPTADPYGYFLSVYELAGRDYVLMTLQDRPVDLSAVAAANAEQVSEHNITVDEEIQTESSISAALKFFFEYFMESVRQARREGYDWDVIKVMIRMEDEQFDKIKDYLTQ